MRTLVIAGGVIAVAAAAGVAGATGVLGADGNQSNTDTGSSSAEATTQVKRGDLVETTTASGTVSYAGGRDITSGLSGTVTWLPGPGAKIGLGKPLYRVDTKPVIRLNGKVPAWRDLGPSTTDGADIEQLERSLLALGYGDEYDMTVDEDWTWVTTYAVKELQEDLGLTETGTLTLGSVVFSDGNLRVSSQSVAVGDTVQQGTQIIATSGSARRVTASLATTQRHLAPLGGTVKMDFPDGTSARGRITGVVAVPAADAQSDPTLQVTVEPSGKKSEKSVGKQLDGASVQVGFTDTLAKDMLIVPVTALVALEEGYAVEVVDGNDTEMVSVETEGYGDTEVAVTGDLAVGDEVEVTP